MVKGDDFAGGVGGGGCEAVAGVVEDGEDGAGGVLGDDAHVVLEGEVETLQSEVRVAEETEAPADAPVRRVDVVESADVPAGDEVVP